MKPDDPTVKWCPRCQQTLPIGDFRLRSRGGWSAYCKPCAADYYRNTRVRDPFVKLRHNLARKGGPVASVPELRTLGEPHTCYLCGRKITWKTAELDHVIPRCRGGMSTIDNLRWAHRRCNRMKHDLTLMEFRQLAKRILDFTS